MNYRSFLHRFAVPVTLCLLASVGSFAGTVTVDFSQKQAVSDSDIFTTKLLNTASDQMTLFVNSTNPQPQELTVKIKGLKPGDQDLYVGGQYKGRKTESELASGIALTIPGRLVNPVLFRCVDSVKARIDSEIKFIEQVQDDEHVRVLYTLRQASGWVKSALQGDKSARSVAVVVAPAGAALKQTVTLSVQNPEESAKVFAETCKMLQMARDRMYDNITFGVLRNQAVAALTPVDLQVSYTMLNGKPKGTAVLVNNCDLPISGKITPSVPVGWKANAANLVFTDLASGKSHKVEFTLTPSTPGTAVPKSVKAEAAVKVAFDTYMAKFTVMAEATQNAVVKVIFPTYMAKFNLSAEAAAGMSVGESVVE